MGSLQEMQKILRQKDERIRDLERQLAAKDDLIQELRSQLDKYQSVMPTSPTAVSFNRKSLKQQRQRGVGISAEPGSLMSKDITNKVLQSYSKTQRWVTSLSVMTIWEFLWWRLRFMCDRRTHICIIWWEASWIFISAIVTNYVQRHAYIALNI